jgi:hypothetical protein
LIQLTDRYFRPTILIFLDGTAGTPQTSGGSPKAADKTIYDYFRDLCKGLDQRLYQGIGLLHINAGETDARLLPIQEQDGAADSPVEGPFADLLNKTLQNIQGVVAGDVITMAGYTVPPGPPQIYIIGETDSPWLQQVAEWVIEGLKRYDLPPLIYYVLIDRYGRPVP